MVDTIIKYLHKWYSTNIQMTVIYTNMSFHEQTKNRGSVSSIILKVC